MAACLLVLPTIALAQSGPPRTPVRVAPVVETRMAPLIWVAGTVQSRNDARLAAEVPGRLVEVSEVGAVLDRDAVVAKIDDTLYRLRLTEAEAIVAREKARLAYLEREVGRQQRLASSNSVAENQLEQTLADRDVARSELAAARARVEQAREDLDRTELRSPFAGVVTERVLRPGERVDTGDIVLRLVNPGTLEVQASVPYDSVPHLSVGATLEVSTAGARHASGQIRTLVPVGDDRSRLYDLRLDLDPNGWKAGQTVRVAVPTAAPRTVVAVPRDALVLRRSGTAVFRVGADGTAERIAVSTGIASGDLIEVVAALTPGDQVVVRGNERLRPGQAVEIQGEGLGAAP